MIYKSFNGIEIKADLEKNIIEGYASIFNNIDSDEEYFTETAFNKSINDWKNASPKKRRIKVLWHHRKLDPIGIPLQLESDKQGLYTVSKISKTVEGEKVLILSRDGVLTEMSVGVIPILEKFDSIRKANALKEVMLMEYSPVTWGSNEETTIEQVKSLFKEYNYSKGNVMDVLALELIKSIRALGEPSKDTQTNNKSQVDEEELIREIKKYL